MAPGSAPVDDSRRVVELLVQQLDHHPAKDDAGIAAIADRFELSERQLRRIVKKELGVSPIQLVQTRRLLRARELLLQTDLPITEIAYASGFSSLRRFNDVFKQHYQMTPTQLRQQETSTPDS